MTTPASITRPTRAGSRYAPLVPRGATRPPRSASFVGRVASASERNETNPRGVSIRPARTSRGYSTTEKRVFRWSSSERQRAYRDLAPRGGLDTPRSFLAGLLDHRGSASFVGRVASASERIETRPLRRSSSERQRASSRPRQRRTHVGCGVSTRSPALPARPTGWKQPAGRPNTRNHPPAVPRCQPDGHNPEPSATRGRRTTSAAADHLAPIGVHAKDDHHPAGPRHDRARDHPVRRA